MRMIANLAFAKNVYRRQNDINIASYICRPSLTNIRLILNASPNSCIGEYAFKRSY